MAIASARIERPNVVTNHFQPVDTAELTQIEGGGFWSRLAESVGRLGEGVGVVTGSPLLILAGRAIYK